MLDSGDSGLEERDLLFFFNESHVPSKKRGPQQWAWLSKRTKIKPVTSIKPILNYDAPTGPTPVVLGRTHGTSASLIPPMN